MPPYSQFYLFFSPPPKDLIIKIKLWPWINSKEVYFQELKKEISFTNGQGVPFPKGGVILIRDAPEASGGDGTLYHVGA